MRVAHAPAANQFGKYTLVAKLATGGMAEIFLARLAGAADFTKLVCVKRILPHLAKDQQLVAMFLAEARIAAQISHPNVCQVFELGEIDGRYFIAMEYLEGVPLSCLRRRDMYPVVPDPRLVAALGIQACEGLHHAHQLKRPDGTLLEVVHRDVSSNNLFATVDGVVKVLDFGIAKVQDATVRTSTGSVKGTYAYMAPEQLRGEAVDRRTDVFAMGIVLWELFARRYLFRRDTDYLTFQAITSDPIPDIRELRPEVPPELAGAIAQALARDRTQRFPTARALGEALGAAVAPYGGPVTAAQLGDELARAFASRIRDQQALIKLAREGGALDLEDDRGPAAGQGTSLATTAVSDEGASSDGVALSAPLPVPAPPQSAPPVFPAWAIATVPASAPSTPSAPAVTTAATRRSAVPIVLLVLAALGGIAAAVYFYLQSKRIAEPPPAPEHIVMSPTPPVLDAPVVATEIDAAEAPSPPDAAPSRAEIRRSRPDRTPERPSGPPGYITFDSAPVYAVIFVDGKRLGETPLVRIELAPGKHAVKAVSPSGATRTLSVSIESGKVAPTRRIEW